MASDKLTILVADDDVELLAILVQHLRGRKCTLLEAQNGTDALALAREHKPTLMILDVMMPGLSGWEVAKRVRDDDSLAHTGIIVLTAIGEGLNALTSPLYGADAAMDKPFDFAELDRKIDEVIVARGR
ncbi:MAG: response regulator [Deltaproteobacteria bacterium]|nr:response regulator [Deltaproteobacteria bacterium]